MGQAHRVDPAAMLLLALGAVLLFANLGNGVLWQDEAETAVLARRVLQFGYPVADDGQNLLEVPSAYAHGPGAAWVYSPWLPFYLLAGAFAAFGESTWVARATFAAFGWLTLTLTWRLAKRLTSDVTVHRLSVALLAGSVAFLLHMRQARYYSLTAALVVASCLAYLHFEAAPARRTALGVGALLAALFHVNFGAMAPVVAAMGWHQLRWGSRRSRRYAAEGALLAGALTVPWLAACYRPGYVQAFSLPRVWDHLEYYVRVTNKYLIPIAAMAVVTLAAAIAKLRPRGRVSLPPARQWMFLAAVVVLQAVLLLVPDQRHLRYLIPVLPLFAIAEAFWLAAAIRRHRLGGAVLAALAIATLVLHTGQPRAPLAEFAGELTHEYRGPMDGVIEHLRQHARPGETVKIPYDDRTVMFYMPALIVQPPSRFMDSGDADWIVIRRDWIPEEFFFSAVYQRLERTHEQTKLDAPDVLWQNREDPGTHQYLTVRGAPPVMIYRRKQS